MTFGRDDKRSVGGGGMRRRESKGRGKERRGRRERREEGRMERREGRSGKKPIRHL